MKKHLVTLVYTSYVHYTIEAVDADAAEVKAWAQFEQSPPDVTYGEWEISDIEELTE